MCCQLQTLRKSEGPQADLYYCNLDALSCLLWNIVPVLRQAYIALDKSELIKLCFYSTFVASGLKGGKWGGFSQCTPTELACPAGLPDRAVKWPAPSSPFISTATTNTATLVWVPDNPAVNEVAGVKAAHCHLSKLQQGGSVPQDITDASAAGWPLAAPSLGHHCVYIHILHPPLQQHP